MNLKKTLKILGAGVVLLAMLVSCGGPELLGIIPVYNGPEVTSTTHQFNNEDFLVIASFDDGTDRELKADEFEVTVDGMKEGYCIVVITYQGEENECYVPMNLAIYPSDNNP